MTKVLDQPKKGVEFTGINLASLTEKWAVEALNNDTSTFQDVIKVMIIACGHSAHDAKCYTLKIHQNGGAVCFWGSKEDCESVIVAFRTIGVSCNLIEA